MNYCCANCFHDKFLQKQISIWSNEIKDCIYCETKETQVININKLQDFFETIIELYDISVEGKTLAETLNKDWNILNYNNNSNKLISDILNDKNLLQYKYINILEKKSNNIWHNFKEELKHNNRYFPNDSDLNAKSLKRIIKNFKSFSYSKEVYRARININNSIFKEEEMGKPPYKIASQGRANPTGISYLYIASDKKTAISEIRPDKGDKVTVAKIKLPDSLSFLDTLNIKNTISPFEYSDNVIRTLYLHNNLLKQFGEELSKPVLPREAHLEYIASQYLTEFVKHNGFDGLIYKSSVGTGYNIVMFTDFNLEFLEIREYHIKNTTIEFS